MIPPKRRNSKYRKDRLSEILSITDYNCKQLEANLGIGIEHYGTKGRGVKATDLIEKGNFVVEYSGELIQGTDKCKEREEFYERYPSFGSYMYFFRFNQKRYCLDATVESPRLGRLINHSKALANLKGTIIRDKDNKPRLIFVAKRNIKVGEELSYNYADGRKQTEELFPWLKQ